MASIHRTIVLLAATLSACSSSAPAVNREGLCGIDPKTVVGTAQGATHDFVITALTLPQQRSDFAYDLNCDRRADNQLGSIVSSLLAQGFDEQSFVDKSIAGGDLITLLRITADDLGSSTNAGATWLAARPTPVPDFTGSGTFTVDESIPEADLFGPMFNAAFSSNPAGVAPPIALDLRLSMPDGTLVTLPLYAAYLRFTVENGPVTRLSGQINGAMHTEDLQALVLPPFAAFFTQELHDDPADHVELQKIFDIGGCSDNGVPAKANDNIITSCELADNQLTQPIFADDVQLFDARGQYDPQPSNAKKDSFSFGLGFTAVQATF
jgi:hypothetical protein